MLVNEAYHLYKADPSSENYELLGATLLIYIIHLVNREFRWFCNTEEMEDIKSNAIIETVKSLPNFRGESQFATWVRGIVSRTGNNYVRAESSKAALPLLDIDAPSRPSTTSTILLGELMKDLDKYDRLLVGMKLRGFEDKEIAEKLNVPLGTVFSQWNRIKVRMRTQGGGANEA